MTAEASAHWVVRVRAEQWRLVAYFFFWTMCGWAKLLTTMFVVKGLRDGADPDTPIEQMGCEPFNRNGGEFDLSFGEGFDFYTQNHLTEYFGFSNICTNWDYTPAREGTSLYFPLFEYSICIYIVLDFVNTKLAHMRGDVPDWFYKLSKGLLVAAIFLATCFRQIFVNKASISTSHHTMGFLCLQFGLIVIALHNVLYVTLTKETYKFFGKILNADAATKLGWIYLFLNLLICIPKVGGGIYIVTHGVGPPFYLRKGIFRTNLGQDVDFVWMLFNAVLPAVIAYVRMINEEPITFDISLPVIDKSSGCENASLTQGGTKGGYSDL